MKIRISEVQKVLDRLEAEDPTGASLFKAKLSVLRPSYERQSDLLPHACPVCSKPSEERGVCQECELAYAAERIEQAAAILKEDNDDAERDSPDF